MKKILALFFIFVFCVCALFVQETNLLYKEKKTFSKEKIISIQLCNIEGLEPLTVEEFQKSDMLYFCYQPMGSWIFKEKDLDNDIAIIQITQNGKNIHQQNIIPRYNTSNKIFTERMASLKK